jgi:hypothetical protein
MKNDVIIVENFYENPDIVRQYALSELKNNNYLPYGNPTWKATKTKKWHECPFKSSDNLIQRLNDITGEEVDLDNWRMDYPDHGTEEDGRSSQNSPQWDKKTLKSAKWNCAFHIKPKIGQTLGNGVHNHVTDVWNSVGADGWVGLVYLNPKAPNESGLFCWENINKNNNYEWMSPAENWKLIDSYGAVFNRLILCRGEKPHSGADGFSNEDGTGRLYQTFFFVTKKESRKSFSSVKINNFF